MNRALRIFLIILGSVLILGFIGLQVMRKNTKRHSPQETVSLTTGGIGLEVTYCRPYKKGRRIFGGLVPYGEVWRTGANEATTFSCSDDIFFGGTRVKAGTYTLWTIPGPDEWEVVLNGKRYGWGVKWGGGASRDPGHDVANVTLPVQHPASPVEQFTIRFTEPPLALVLEWDDVMVEVPLGR